MNINNKSEINLNTFRAKLLSQYSLKNVQSSSEKKVNIFQLDKSDSAFIDEFIKNSSDYDMFDENKTLIFKETLQTIKDVFLSPCQFLDKVKILVAEMDQDPVGILVGNLPKKTKNGYLTYSSRHNSKKYEGEIDWLITFPNKNLKVKGVGKALVCEFFHSLKKDKITDVFVRSELPELSFATMFYSKMGFEEIMNKRVTLKNNCTNECLINDYSNPSDYVIPMLAKKTVIQEKIKENSTKMKRQECMPKSVNMHDFINL